MSRLKRFGLPLQRRRATVFIDRPPCIPCRLFLAAIQEATGIQICVFPQAIVETPARKNRSGLGVCMNCSCTNCKRAGKTSASRCANDYGESIPAPVSTPLGWSRLEGRDGANVCHKPIHTPVFTNPFQDKTDEPVSISPVRHFKVLSKDLTLYQLGSGGRPHYSSCSKGLSCLHGTFFFGTRNGETQDRRLCTSRSDLAQHPAHTCARVHQGDPRAKHCVLRDE